LVESVFRLPERGALYCDVGVDAAGVEQRPEDTEADVEEGVRDCGCTVNRQPIDRGPECEGELRQQVSARRSEIGVRGVDAPRRFAQVRTSLEKFGRRLQGGGR